jgi:hypothetical protein
MLRRLVARVSFTLVVAIGIVPVASAQQPLGTFRWQLTPFCNVINVTVTQSAGMFTLDGFDDQCGAATRAAAIGTAFQNPNGSIGIGLSIVATPGAAPLHLDVALNPATLGGPWRDSAGNTGTLVFSPPAPAAGAPRPATGGPISMVTPGVGLSGGGTAGTINLAVDFGGTGAATTVARSDHTHAVTGIDNVGVGPAALGLVASGESNTAMGSRALASLSTGQFNTAVGHDALTVATTADWNVGVGYRALLMGNGLNNVAVGGQALMQSNGNGNTAVGTHALASVNTGNTNTAVGVSAMYAATGSQNIAIGWGAGGNLRNGDANIYIGTVGPPDAGFESGHVRIGNNQTATFIAGIFGGGVVGHSGLQVFVDASGRLGTTVSSARFKQDIQPLAGLSSLIHRLEPVTFRYRPEQERGNALQYGLIAEQVAQVMPDLVIRDGEGRPFSVKYDTLPTLLLAEIQRLERERASQADAIAAQALALEELRKELDRLRNTGRDR